MFKTQVLSHHLQNLEALGLVASARTRGHAIGKGKSIETRTKGSRNHINRNRPQTRATQSHQPPYSWVWQPECISSRANHVLVFWSSLIHFYRIAAWDFANAKDRRKLNQFLWNFGLFRNILIIITNWRNFQPTKICGPPIHITDTNDACFCIFPLVSHISRI